jgi:PAS domain S-box-containing protein
MPDRFNPTPMAWRWPIVAAMVLVLLLGGLSSRRYLLFARATADADRASEIIEAIDGLVSRLVDAETGNRGYVITGNQAFLQPYGGVGDDVRLRLNHLRELVSSTPHLLRMLDGLDLLCTEKVTHMSRVVSAFDGGDPAGAARLISEGFGKRTMDEIRRRAAEMRRDAQSTVNARQSQARLAQREALLYAGSTVGVAALLGLIGVGVSRTLERRRLALASETIARLEAEGAARDREASLRQSEDFNQSLLDNTRDAVAVLGLDGRIVLMNRPGMQLMELSPEGAWRDEPWPALWGAHRAVAESAVAAARSAGDGRFVANRPLAAGTAQWWDVLVSPIKDADGHVVRLVALARDITEQKRSEEQKAMLLDSERAARGEAERAARMKDDFVSTLSHELRTPLNAIVGWVGVLKRDSRPETLATAIDVVDRNARRQSQMIDDLLDIGRIISGKLRLDVQRLDLAATIEEAVASAQPAADAKGIRLVQVLGSAAIVEGDPGRLQQVFWNLVSNAIKFTAKGGKVQVTLRKIASHVQVQVSDTGVGIRAEVLPHIFERFHQGREEAAGRHAGLGLGLAIAKNLVEMHGGSLEAASDGEGQGSTFTVRLPIAPSHSRERLIPELSSLPQMAGILDGVTVLVVDDEPDARDIVRRLLEDAGAAVVATATAAEALSQLASGVVPDVILSDIGMPAQDGYEFMHQVRSLEGPVRSVPAAALTALARGEDRKRALMAGYQSHLAKPVDPAELVAMVASLTGRTGRS